MPHLVPKVFALALSLTLPCAVDAIAADWGRHGIAGLPKSWTAPSREVGLFHNGERLALGLRETRRASNAQKLAKLDRSGDRIGRLRNLIAHAEAGPKGYDAVHSSAKVLPPAPPTSLTLGQVFAWIKRTPQQNHAIGRYQFIPATLRDLVRRGGVPLSARFTPQLQDRLADILLQDAGLHAFQSGRISRTRFMNNLALIWAGLPTSSGRSAYHGYAGNRATIDWATYNQEMAAIFR